MYDRILIPTDDGEQMEAVFEHAAEIAKRHEASLDVVHVVDKRAYLTLDEEIMDDVERQLGEQGEEATQRAVEWFEQEGVDVETTNLSGDPAEEIVAHADETDTDLIVMGTRRRDYSQTMLGSVSEEIVSRARRPVLIVDIAGE